MERKIKELVEIVKIQEKRIEQLEKRIEQYNKESIKNSINTIEIMKDLSRKVVILENRSEKSTDILRKLTDHVVSGKEITENRWRQLAGIEAKEK
ncbi:MAG: hypothetical protein Q3988_00065 [Gemella sp.]|nr:hypothetical protein [Gemella sp.]